MYKTRIKEKWWFSQCGRTWLVCRKQLNTSGVTLNEPQTRHQTLMTCAFISTGTPSLEEKKALTNCANKEINVLKNFICISFEVYKSQSIDVHLSGFPPCLTSVTICNDTTATASPPPLETYDEVRSDFASVLYILYTCSSYYAKCLCSIAGEKYTECTKTFCTFRYYMKIHVSDYFKKGFDCTFGYIPVYETQKQGILSILTRLFIAAAAAASFFRSCYWCSAVSGDLLIFPRDSSNACSVRQSYLSLWKLPIYDSDVDNSNTSAAVTPSGRNPETF